MMSLDGDHLLVLQLLQVILMMSLDDVCRHSYPGDSDSFPTPPFASPSNAGLFVMAGAQGRPVPNACLLHHLLVSPKVV